MSTSRGSIRLDALMGGGQRELKPPHPDLLRWTIAMIGFGVTILALAGAPTVRILARLHPAIDQTRTVGLVTLPGAFVGVLLGGGSAGDAAAAQVLVLVGLLAAESCVAETSRRLIASGRIMPRDLRVLLPRR